jgi:phage protein D
MAASRRTSLSIKYNGKNITTKLNDFLEQFKYTDVASGEADTLDLTVSDDKHKWISSWFPVEGDYVEGTIYVHDWMKIGDNRNLKCGKFYLDDFGFSGPGDIATLGSVSKPVESDFSTTERNKSWKDVTLEGIAKSIAKSAGVTLYYEGPSYKISKLEQSGQTDMNFLFNLCSNYNLAMKLYNKKIVIFDEVKYEEKKALYSIDKKKCDTYEPHATLAGMYDGVQIRYTNSDTNKTLIYKYMIKNSGKRILIVNEKAESHADAEVKAKAKLRAANKTAMTLDITLMGDVKYIAGTCVNITGFGKFDGKYYIDKVIHDLSNGYSCSINMHKTLGIKLDTIPTTKLNIENSSKYLKDEIYVLTSNLIGYYTADEARADKSSGHKTARTNKGKYYIFNYHKPTGMINVTKVKGVPGSWINPSKNI